MHLTSFDCKLIRLNFNGTIYVIIYVLFSWNNKCEYLSYRACKICQSLKTIEILEGLKIMLYVLKDIHQKQVFK